MTLRDEDGDAKFPGLNPVTGGTLLGVPVILSKGARNNLILLNAESIAIADYGTEFELSRHTALQMSNTPTEGTGGASMISLWQANSTALKFTHYISWVKVDADSVAFLELPIAASPDV